MTIALLEERVRGPTDGIAGEQLGVAERGVFELIVVPSGSSTQNSKFFSTIRSVRAVASVNLLMPDVPAIKTLPQ
jgi:hypothetical protein